MFHLICPEFQFENFFKNLKILDYENLPKISIKTKKNYLGLLFSLEI